MKRIIIIVIIFAAALAVVCDGNLLDVTKNIQYNTLVGEWLFNGNSLDSSGNGNDGTVYGSLFTTNRFDIENTAYSFDGVNDYINIPYNSELSLLDGKMSVSLWILLSQDIISTQARIIGQYNGSSNPTWSINILGNGYGGSTGNQINFNVGDGSIFYNTNSNNITTGNWYNIVVLDDNGIAFIYINGSLITQDNSSHVVMSNITADITIGSSTGAFFFPGKIDDVRIYKKILSQGEIYNLYHEGE